MYTVLLPVTPGIKHQTYIKSFRSTNEKGKYEICKCRRPSDRGAYVTAQPSKCIGYATVSQGAALSFERRQDPWKAPIGATLISQAAPLARSCVRWRFDGTGLYHSRRVALVEMHVYVVRARQTKRSEGWLGTTQDTEAKRTVATWDLTNELNVHLHKSCDGKGHDGICMSLVGTRCKGFPL